MTPELREGDVIFMAYPPMKDEAVRALNEWFAYYGIIVGLNLTCSALTTPTVVAIVKRAKVSDD